MNQNEENISVHDLEVKDFKNGFPAKRGKELGLREGAAKPMESMLEIENGKTDTVDMAKVSFCLVLSVVVLVIKNYFPPLFCCYSPSRLCVDCSACVFHVLKCKCVAPV